MPGKKKKKEKEEATVPPGHKAEVEAAVAKWGPQGVAFAPVAPAGGAPLRLRASIRPSIDFGGGPVSAVFAFAGEYPDSSPPGLDFEGLGGRFSTPHLHRLREEVMAVVKALLTSTGCGRR
eukprot:gene24527-39605_t